MPLPKFEPYYPAYSQKFTDRVMTALTKYKKQLVSFHKWSSHRISYNI